MSRVAVSLVVAAVLGSAGLLVYMDRGSLERGNRLFRTGDAERAAAIYRSRARDGGGDGDAEDARPLYNLGTAEVFRSRAPVGVDSVAVGEAAEDPEALLRSAAAIARERGDRDLAVQSHYNLGVLHLDRHRNTAGALPPDSSVRVLTASAEQSRLALRLDPTHSDARWNLALARRALDSLASSAVALEGEIEPREGDPDDIEFDLGGLTRVESGEGDPGPTPDDPNDPESPQEAQDPGDVRLAVEGAREALAGQDPGPLSPSDASRILDDVSDPAEALIRGILWSHRPDLPYWESPPLPGGNW